MDATCIVVVYNPMEVGYTTAEWKAGARMVVSPGGVVGTLMLVGACSFLIYAIVVLLRGKRVFGAGNQPGAWLSLGAVSRDWLLVGPFVGASCVLLFHRDEVGNSALPWDGPHGMALLMPFIASVMLAQESLIWHLGRSPEAARRLGSRVVRLERLSQTFCVATFGMGDVAGERGWQRWLILSLTIAGVAVLAFRAASDSPKRMSPEMREFFEGA